MISPKDPFASKGSYYDSDADYDPRAGPSYADAPPPSYSSPPEKRPPLAPGGSSHFSVSSFAPAPGGPGPELPGDNVKGFMGHVKNFAPGKSPVKLLDPPPPSFLRPPPPPSPERPYAPFPVLVLIGKGSTLDRGFPYVAPVPLGGERMGAGALVPHPFVTHDVAEQDWRRFLHDIRVVGSLSPLNRVVSGLAPLALGIGIIFGFFIVKGIDGVMRRTKRGPVSQLIDHWNQSFFHPRCIHIGLVQGPPKDGKGRRDTSQGNDKNWRLIVSYRPYTPT